MGSSYGFKARGVMRFVPHDYQRAAIAWVQQHPHCGLFMEMGLGKSVCTLTAIQNLIDDLAIGRVLVVAPKKVAETTWSDEAAKWDHLELRVSVVKGTTAQRRAALAADADIYVLGRDSVVWLESLKDGKERPRFDMIVLDELTSFKHSTSQRFKAMRRLRREAVRVVGLTGTPTPNGLLDLWGQMCCIDGGERLGKFVTHYRARYFDSVTHNNIPIKIWPRKGAEEAILEKISDICFTMRAADYLELPPMVIHDRRVDIGEKAAKGYKAFERDRVAEFNAAGLKGTVTADSAASLVNKLAQYANGCVYDEEHGEHEIHDAKISALLELVEMAASPVLCFYAYKHDLRRILEHVPKGVKVRSYTGPEDLRDWNAGTIDLLLAHPASTAYGLNMQQGGHVAVWFSTGWNLELYQQANARLHRQGQKMPVAVYNLIASGTVDERMAEALRGKGESQAGVVKKLALDIAAAQG